MLRVVPVLLLLVLFMPVKAILAQAATTEPRQHEFPDDSRSEHWHSVLLYGDFAGSAFDNVFNRNEVLVFDIRAENGGRLQRRIDLTVPVPDSRFFLGEISINQKDVVLTVQATHSYQNPASSYKFPIMNAKNQRRVNFETNASTEALASGQLVSVVTIKVTGNEGWFSDPSYEIEIVPGNIND